MPEVDHHLYADIVKTEEQADGSLYVFGKLSDGHTVDAHGQITDAATFQPALKKWMTDWGNVRLEHQPHVVGTATEVAFEGDNSFLGAKIIDEDAIRKVRAGALKGLSYGLIKGTYEVKKGSRGQPDTVYITKDDAIAENSLVDRPSNPEARIELWKRAPEGDDDPDVDLTKADFTDDERKKLADSGEAMPDGSYPIRNVSDLENAIHAYGRAKDKSATRAHIIKRAKALNAEDKLPEGWDGSSKAVEPDLTKADDETAQVALADTAIGIIRQLIIAEASEPDDETFDLYTLVQVLSSLRDFKLSEEQEATMAKSLEAEMAKGDFNARNLAMLKTMHNTISKMAPGICPAGDDNMDKSVIAEQINEVTPDLIKSALVEAGVEGLRDEVATLKAQIDEIGGKLTPTNAYLGGAQNPDLTKKAPDPMRARMVRASLSTDNSIAEPARSWLATHPEN